MRSIHALATLLFLAVAVGLALPQAGWPCSRKKTWPGLRVLTQARTARDN